VVDDVAYATYTDRPGMTTVTRLPNGKYMMTYEFGGGPLASGSTDYEFPVRIIELINLVSNLLLLLRHGSQIILSRANGNKLLTSLLLRDPRSGGR
jgi:hypothetical protein